MVVFGGRIFDKVIRMDPDLVESVSVQGDIPENLLSLPQGHRAVGGYLP